MKSIIKLAGCTVLAGAAVSEVAARTLFNKVIPRQDQVRVNLDEMADKEQWEEYKKIIHVNKEWLLSQNMEHITINAQDNIVLHADYLPAQSAESKKMAICFHGYTSCGINDCSSIARFLHNMGFGCLIVDNRAHGKSEGDYVGFGILDRYDCLSWINYVNERFEEKKDILLFGVSMGAATVLMASGFAKFPDNVKAIIADCAFTSPYEVFAHILKRDYKLPEFPIMNRNDKLCRRKAGYGFKDYSTLEAVRNTSCPILFIHGEKDNFVPVDMSRQNYDECASEKELLIVENAGHAASYYENRSLYESKAEDFIKRYIP